MKATIDVPDDLYRRVKARSAMQARTVREVTVSLYRSWLARPEADHAEMQPVGRQSPPTWFGGARRYAERVEKHDMDSIRASIAQGRKAAGDRS